MKKIHVTMKKIALIILICLINGSYIKADVYNDICELLNVYDSGCIEHHKKQGIDIILIYDCINDSVIENYNLDNIGVYGLRLGNESSGIEFILLKVQDNYMVFHNIEPNRTQILREIIRISKKYPYALNSTAMNNILHNIINPNGSWIRRQVLSPVDTIGKLKLYFDLESIRNKGLLSKSIFNERTNK